MEIFHEVVLWANNFLKCVWGFSELIFKLIQVFRYFWHRSRCIFLNLSCLILNLVKYYLLLWSPHFRSLILLLLWRQWLVLLDGLFISREFFFGFDDVFFVLDQLIKQSMRVRLLIHNILNYRLRLHFYNLSIGKGTSLFYFCRWIL